MAIFVYRIVFLTGIFEKLFRFITPPPCYASGVNVFFEQIEKTASTGWGSNMSTFH